MYRFLFSKGGFESPKMNDFFSLYFLFFTVLYYIYCNFIYIAQ